MKKIYKGYYEEKATIRFGDEYKEVTFILTDENSAPYKWGLSATVEDDEQGKYFNAIEYVASETKKEAVFQLNCMKHKGLDKTEWGWM